MKPLWTKGSTKASPVTWDSEVPYSPFLFCQTPFTEKSLGELVLHNFNNIMHKHISLTLLPIPSHQSSCIYSTHSSWGIIMVTSRCIHHDQVPFFECKLAL
ncbi:hypothetical protein ACJW30_12G012800 [Castanea mollissima]